MYSRYPDYQPFDPMQNRLAQSYGRGGGHVQNESLAPETAVAMTPLSAEQLPAIGKSGNGQLNGDLLSTLRTLGGTGALGSGGLGSLLGKNGILGKGGLQGILGKNGITGLLKNLSINWDSGDILLGLILLFLSMEGDDDEILLLLGLMLLLGL
ncbi:MAG: hypothetical protein FWH04_03725 [Oscillospiraceae bacterium]|nr:hypothetical protein [Oscillospiraceae bacterium]